MTYRAVLGALLVAACGGSSSSWKEQDVPAPSALTAYSVWVAGDHDVWLGGAGIWHFDGTAWSESSAMSAVDFWGFAPDDIWAINESKVARWNGSTWSEVPPTAGLTFEALWRIWGSTSSDVWLANQDNSKVYHYDGQTWTRQTLQFVMVDALWGSAKNDIWLSGPFDLYRYNGTWQKYSGNDAPTGINDLWGSGPNDVWAASGFDGLSHWDGSRWTAALDEDAEADDFNSVWGAASNDVWAVGDNGGVGHFDGDSWSTSRELSASQSFTMVHGSSRDNIWATAVDLRAQKAMVFRYQP